MAENGVKQLKISIVAGEESGDQLGAAVIESLRSEVGAQNLVLHGVGGSRMAALGLDSLFSISDIAVMGITAVLQRLPLILRRIRETSDAIVAFEPDVLLIIDSPDFTHRVAKRVRKRVPDIRIVDYVSPTVWAWRPGRARAMAAYVDRLLAILPFEPDIHVRLGGPKCDYVGHPLIERLEDLRPSETERPPLDKADTPVLLILPGSRRGEIERMMPVFRDTVAEICERSTGPIDLILPAVPHLAELVAEKLTDWPVPAQIVTGEEQKLAAFRRAHAALAASGTVSLELALSQVPMVVAYMLDPVYRLLNHLRYFFPNIVQVDTMVLPNLILGDKPIPEYLDTDATPKALADAVLPLLQDGAERSRQLDAFSRLEDAMALPGGEKPATLAARIILSVAGNTKADQTKASLPDN